MKFAIWLFIFWPVVLLGLLWTEVSKAFEVGADFMAYWRVRNTQTPFLETKIAEALKQAETALADAIKTNNE